MLKFKNKEEENNYNKEMSTIILTYISLVGQYCDKYEAALEKPIFIHFMVIVDYLEDLQYGNIKRCEDLDILIEAFNKASDRYDEMKHYFKSNKVSPTFS